MSVENRRPQDAASRVMTVCGVIAEIVKSGEEHFLHDVQAQWAAEMGLIRIGGAVAKIPASVRACFAGHTWRQIIDMRNFAAHQYDHLDPRRMWRTLTRDVPRLRDYLNDVMLPVLSAGPHS